MAENKQKTILIVEDEISQLNVLADEFESEGFRVLKAQNGHDGFDLALLERPDIILLDIVMPVMDGMAMMKKLREKNSWGKKVPIILLTNLSADNDARIMAIARDEPAYYLVKSDHLLSEVVEKVKERLAG